MVEYYISEHNSHFLWKYLQPALEACTADLHPSDQNKSEVEGCTAIKDLAQKYGSHLLIKCVKETLKANCVYELYWLARAGISEVKSYLVEFLYSEDEDELTSAILGLIYLEYELAWTYMEELIKGEHLVKLQMPPSWYFKEDLEVINNLKSKEMLNLMTKT